MNSSEQAVMLSAIRDLDDALGSVQQRAQKWVAGQLLSPTDEHGIQTVKPYTPEAIAIIEAAFERDVRDCDLIHHLAIAYHALAWDLEWKEPETAVNAWTKALFYWRKLQACADFWQALIQKGVALGNAFDEQTITTFRHNLLHYLLEIHVEFIRHYYEQQQYEQAIRHIELIRQARIPPAMRKELTVMVYDAMISTVPQAKLDGRFPEALVMLDGFLRFFPVYIPALQLYLEIIADWVAQLSPAEQWPEILSLSAQALPRWVALKNSDQLSQHTLAQSTLSNLAALMGQKHWSKARSLKSKRNARKQQPQSLDDKEYEAYQKTIAWFRKLDFSRHAFPEARHAFYYALLSKAEFATQLGLATNDDQLLTSALADCTMAIDILPEDGNAPKLAAQILHLGVELTLANLPANPAIDFVSSLDLMERDIERALEYDPENSDMQYRLEWIREAKGRL